MAQTNRNFWYLMKTRVISIYEAAVYKLYINTILRSNSAYTGLRAKL